MKWEYLFKDHPKTIRNGVLAALSDALFVAPLIETARLHSVDDDHETSNTFMYPSNLIFNLSIYLQFMKCLNPLTKITIKFQLILSYICVCMCVYTCVDVCHVHCVCVYACVYVYVCLSLKVSWKFRILKIILLFRFLFAHESKSTAEEMTASGIRGSISGDHIPYIFGYPLNKDDDVSLKFLKFK